MSRKPHTTVAAAVALTPISSPTPTSTTPSPSSPPPLRFRSLHPIEGNGGGGISGYGGWTLAFALISSWHSLSASQQNLRLYSALGHFLGPANTVHPLTSTVTSLRNTRTFATRSILISQAQADGSVRNVMSLSADFMAPEQNGSFVVYDAGTARAYGRPEEGVSWEEGERMATGWGWSEQGLEGFRGVFEHFRGKFEMRACRGGFSGMGARGLVPQGVRTEMDAVRSKDKGSAEWYRPWRKYESYIDALITVPYILDNNIAGDVGDWNRIDWHEEAAAISSLEFALRFFTNDLDLNDWHMRENKSIAAGVGRTFQEACLFDRNGKMLAQLSEQCVFRPHKGKANI